MGQARRARLAELGVGARTPAAPVARPAPAPVRPEERAGPRETTAWVYRRLREVAARDRLTESRRAAAVRDGRRLGLSWDAMSLALGGTPNGETLRRRYG
jgi:hypothetical protein